MTEDERNVLVAVDAVRQRGDEATGERVAAEAGLTTDAFGSVLDHLSRAGLVLAATDAHFSPGHPTKITFGLTEKGRTALKG